MSRNLGQSRRRFLVTSASAAAATSLSMLACTDLQIRRTIAAGASTKDNNAMQQNPPLNLPLPIEGDMPTLDGALGWLNSDPITLDDLRGKVVLVEFWTYTCINWLRTLPYVRAWFEKYQDHGLVVIGVHTPEFPFEKNLENIRRAVDDMNIAYPVAIDSDYAVWRAFKNNYWPAMYFADARGHIRHHHFGENEYDRSEAVIQALLAEAGFSGFGNDLVAVDGTGAEAQADWADLRSGETYVGFNRSEGFASSGGIDRGNPHVYAIPERMGLNRWALAGDWTVSMQDALLNEPYGRIAFHFHARDLHLVMGPSTPGGEIRYRVTLDGQQPGAAHGFDVDEHGTGVIREQRLHQLIRQPEPIEDRQFEIQFLDAGAQAFVFTFG